MTDLAGKVALVTGAQQGIGRAIAIALARARADVVINYLDDVRAAEDVAAEVHSTGQRAVLAPGDVAGSGTPARLVEATVAAFGKIDILVNNAGVFPRVPFLEMTETDWDLVHSINLKASCFCAQAAARSMVAAGQGGVIICMASSAIFGASQRGVHYSASKGGVVAPGLTDTAQPRYGSTEEELAARAAAMPLGRMGQPEDIANVAVFLASEKSAFMTGQTVHANGGVFMAS